MCKDINIAPILCRVNTNLFGSLFLVNVYPKHRKYGVHCRTIIPATRTHTDRHRCCIDDPHGSHVCHTLLVYYSWAGGRD